MHFPPSLRSIYNRLLLSGAGLCKWGAVWAGVFTVNSPKGQLMVVECWPLDTSENQHFPQRIFLRLVPQRVYGYSEVGTGFLEKWILFEKFWVWQRCVEIVAFKGRRALSSKLMWWSNLLLTAVLETWALRRALSSPCPVCDSPSADHLGPCLSAQCDSRFLNVLGSDQLTQLW